MEVPGRWQRLVEQRGLLALTLGCMATLGLVSYLAERNKPSEPPKQPAVTEPAANKIAVDETKTLASRYQRDNSPLSR